VLKCCHIVVKIAAGAVVCVESEIRGDVTIGARSVVHPKARIIAEAGPIIIGEGNLIEEQALIINSYPENRTTPDSEGDEPKAMIIGTNNVFEVGCVSQALKIGDNNVIESKADLGRNVTLTSGCIIGACCQINTSEVVPENMVVYGSCKRRVQSERPQPQTLQLDFLMKILPNYHHLKKTTKANSTPVRS
uniref:Dynactin subunit 6 n=1 Tax=Gouania willdenowi TaxID=441366 RepID=A0A8C5GPJ0_GOUWI